MIRLWFGLTWVGLTAVSGLAFAAAPVAPDWASELPARIEQGIANGRWQSVVVAWVDRDARGQWLLGTASPGGVAPRATDTFELGSSSRLFTGLMFAKALTDGKVRLEESLAQVFPEVRFGDPDLAAVTLEQLATQHAGLAQIPPNLFPRQLADPYADYDDAALLAFMTRGQLAHAVGEHAYSDLGTALLGAALAKRFGTDFRQLVATQILAPLKMLHSGFGSVPNLLEGHDNGEAALHWRYQAFSAAGGMRASLADLSVFVQANLKPDDSPLRAPILLARQPRASAGAGHAALAWQVVMLPDEKAQSWPLVWQAGLSDGFASFVGFRSDRQRALVLLGNAGTDLSGLGLAALSERDLPPAPPKLAVLPDGQGSDYAGLYRFDDDSELVVRADVDGLQVQLPGLLPLPVLALDRDLFQLRNSDSVLRFQRGPGSRVDGALLLEPGLNLHARRLSDQAPSLKRAPRALSAPALAEYAGDYALSPTLLARVVAAGDGLRLQLTARPAWMLRSHAIDRFGDAQGTLEARFTRDARGAVSALSVRVGSFEAAGPRVQW